MIVNPILDRFMYHDVNKSRVDYFAVESDKHNEENEVLYVRRKSNNKRRKKLEEFTKIPDDLHLIQPQSTQVWNCDKVDVEPNSKCNKVVCAYKWSLVNKIWKIQTGERAPF